MDLTSESFLSPENIHLFIHPFIHLSQSSNPPSIHPHFYPFIYHSVHPCTHLSIQQIFGCQSLRGAKSGRGHVETKVVGSERFSQAPPRIKANQPQKQAVQSFIWGLCSLMKFSGPQSGGRRSCTQQGIWWGFIHQNSDWLPSSARDWSPGTKPLSIIGGSPRTPAVSRISPPTLIF